MHSKQRYTATGIGAVFTCLILSVSAIIQLLNRFVKMYVKLLRGYQSWDMPFGIGLSGSCPKSTNSDTYIKLNELNL